MTKIKEPETVSSMKNLTFAIEGTTPETMPLDILAKIIAELPNFLENPHDIHLFAIEKGSCALQLTIDEDNKPCMEKHLNNIATADISEKTRKSQKNLNTILGEANLTANLKKNFYNNSYSNVISFPGKKKHRQQELSFSEEMEIQGELTSLSKDVKEVFHATISSVCDGIVKCQVEPSLVKRLQKYLFTDIRVYGIGRLNCREGEQWKIQYLRIEDFVPLKKLPIGAVVGEMRHLTTEWPADLSEKILQDREEEL